MKRMKKEKAKEIAKDFFKDMNPNFWNGGGKMPETFLEGTWEYNLTEDIILEITMVYDDCESKWKHYCDLVQRNDSIDMATGSGSDSISNLADTIMYLCKIFE